MSFFFQFCQFLLRLFWGLCYYVHIFIIVLASEWADLLIIKCPIYLQYFVLKSILSDNTATSAFYGCCLHDIYFPDFFFQSICVFESEVYILQTTCNWILCFIWPENLFLLIRQFNHSHLMLLLTKLDLPIILFSTSYVFLKIFLIPLLLLSFALHEYFLVTF